MAHGDCVVDMSPRWVVLFRKPDAAFSLKFNDMDKMLKAVMNAKAIGYKVTTLMAKPERRALDSK